MRSYDEVCQLLTVTPESNAGLFYVSLGLFHPDPKVRAATVELLERVAGHVAGRHFWAHLGRFAKLAFARAKRESRGGMGVGAGVGSGVNSPVVEGGGPAGFLEARDRAEGGLRMG